MEIKMQHPDTLAPVTALHAARLQQQVVSRVSSSAFVLQGDLQGLARLVTEQVGRLMCIERVSVWLANETKDELICQDIFFLSTGRHEKGALLQKSAFGPEFDAMVQSKFVDASDPYTDPRTKGYVETYLKPNRISSMLDAVVRIGEELIGTVCFEHVDVAHTWSDDEIVFASQIGDQMALTVSIARAHGLNTRLIERDKQLHEINEQLEARVRERSESLIAARNALMESEKLAALGAIVAGVAHELNTPIGNARMVATTILDTARTMSEKMASGQLQKSSLMHFLEDQQRGAHLLDSSLEKASALISSFKNVSADQTSGLLRVFELDKVLADVLAMMSPALNRASCKVTVLTQIPAKLMMESYPGALGQVLVNLINNALLHAFENREIGSLHLSATQKDADSVELLFRDDGLGIPADNVPRIFNPFFTTKLGKGGSGLGLHLVHNIVTKNLGGQIAVVSQPGHGTTFRLLLPLKVDSQLLT